MAKKIVVNASTKAVFADLSAARKELAASMEHYNNKPLDRGTQRSIEKINDTFRRVIGSNR